jgi:hypothetical protein
MADGRGPRLPLPEHLRAALERTRNRPPLPEAERDRDRKLIAEVKSDPATWRTHEEVMADLEARRPHAAE